MKEDIRYVTFSLRSTSVAGAVLMHVYDRCSLDWRGFEPCAFWCTQFSVLCFEWCSLALVVLTGYPRSHSIKLSGCSSKICAVLFGVPQGSIPGPLLYTLYRSNFVNVASQHGLMIHLYADDTQLYLNVSVAKILKTSKSI